MNTAIYSEILRSLPPVFSVNDLREVLKARYSRKPILDLSKILQRMTDKGRLVRLKRDAYGIAKSDPLVLANYLVKPSYISFETALSLYGLIPERVYAILSVCSPHKKISYQNEIGEFIYTQQRADLFAEGMDIITLEADKRLYIASKEKAVLDTISRSNAQFSKWSVEDMIGFLENDLRIEFSELLSLRKTKLKRLARYYRSKGPGLLLSALTVCEKKGGRK